MDRVRRVADWIDQCAADALRAGTAPGFVAAVPGHAPLDPEGFLEVTRAGAAAFPGRRHTVEWTVADGDRFVSAVVFGGRHAATGRQVRVPGVWIDRFDRAGAWVSHEERFDRRALEEQLAAPPELMATAQRMLVQVEALAALAATLRLELEGLDGHPEVTSALGDVAASLGFDAQARASRPEGERHAVLGQVRAFLRQALDVVEQPGRPPGWSFDDPVLLQAQGRASGSFAAIVRRIAPSLPGLSARLDGGGALLDVGTGVGFLSIAMAQEFPASRAVGLDVWAPALLLAVRNVADAGVGDRVEVRHQDVVALAERDVYALAWVPGPFLPADVVPAAIARVVDALEPGGWLAFGTYASPPDPLAERLAALRIVRSGGVPWSPDAVVAMLAAAGLTDVAPVARDWAPPIGLVVGRKPTGTA